MIARVLLALVKSITLGYTISETLANRPPTMAEYFAHAELFCNISLSLRESLEQI